MWTRIFTTESMTAVTVTQCQLSREIRLKVITCAWLAAAYQKCHNGGGMHLVKNLLVCIKSAAENPCASSKAVSQICGQPMIRSCIVHERRTLSLHDNAHWSVC